MVVKEDPVLSGVDFFVRVKFARVLPALVSEEGIVEHDELVAGHMHFTYLGVDMCACLEKENR